MTDYPLPARLLPHAYPFVLIDRILEREQDKRIVCRKNVTINEEFFKGHFPDQPLMPGALIIEAMAQASGLVVGSPDKPAAGYLTRVHDARFKKPVVPGDQLVITSLLTQAFAPLYVFAAEVRVNDAVVAQADITLTVVV
jgi:beta-hydroxyacyl-ACP dehydratase FabZ